MTLGKEDLAAELGVEPIVESLFHPCQQVVIAACAAAVDEPVILRARRICARAARAAEDDGLEPTR